MGGASDDGKPRDGDAGQAETLLAAPVEPTQREPDLPPSALETHASVGEAIARDPTTLRMQGGARRTEGGAARPSSEYATRPDGAGASWDAAHLPPLPDRIGRFRIERRLGAGGMGMVFEGRDETLDRKVAVKLLRLDEGGSSSDEASTRLLREAQALARVSHPNVISVYEVGTWRGQVFVAMEFIDGETFEDWQRHPELGWSEILEAYLEAGRGLMAAHDAGIVHRDFKPSNVMRARDGRVVVLDFGLARDASRLADEPEGPILDRTRRLPSGPDVGASPAAASGSGSGSGSGSASASASGWRRSMGDAMATPLTRTGAVMGTPAYMSPEQHEGGPTDARTDQFSFAVALYEALYGERPFEGGSLAMLASAVIEGRVRTAPEYSQVPSWVRDELLRALAVDPDARFDSMADLLAALRPQQSRRGWLYAGLGVTALALVVAVLLWTRGEGPTVTIDAARAQLDAALSAAEAEGRALDAEGRGTPANLHWDALVLAHARESMERDPTEAFASLRHLSAGEAESVPAARVLAAEAVDRGVAWRALRIEGLRDAEIDALGHHALFLDDEGRVLHWRIDDEQLRVFEAGEGSAREEAVAIALAATGRIALVAGREGTLWEYDLEEGTRSEAVPRTGCRAPEVHLDRDGRRAVLLCEGKWRRLRQGARGWDDAPTPTLSGPIRDLVIESDGTRLLVASGDEADAPARVIYVPRGAMAPSEEGEPLPGVRAFVAHPGASEAAHHLRSAQGVYDLSRESIARSMPREAPTAFGAAGLVWGDGEELVVERGREGRRLLGHGAPLRRVLAAPIQSRVISIDDQGEIRVWRTRRGGGRILDAEGGGVEALDLAAEGSLAFTGARDGRVSWRELPRGPQKEIGKLAGVVRRLDASPRGDAVAVVGDAAGVRIFRRRGEPTIFAKGQQPARALAWSHGGDRVAAGACTTGEACAVHIFEPASGREVQRGGPARAPTALAFAPDDARVAAVEPEDDGARIWIGSTRLEGAAELERAEGSYGRVHALGFVSPERITVAWSPNDEAGQLVLDQVDIWGNQEQLRSFEGLDAILVDGPWIAWQSEAEITFMDLEAHRIYRISELAGPWSGMVVNAEGSGAALFPAEPGGDALVVDFASHERRRVPFGERASAWGRAFVDTPGAYLRIYEDTAPREPLAFARWLAAESSVWVDPASMTRSSLPPPASERAPESERTP